MSIISSFPYVDKGTDLYELWDILKQLRHAVYVYEVYELVERVLSRHVASGQSQSGVPFVD